MKNKQMNTQAQAALRFSIKGHDACQTHNTSDTQMIEEMLAEKKIRRERMMKTKGTSVWWPAAPH